MPIWFEGESEIDCTIQQVKDAFDNHGEHYVGLIRLMPGLTSVEIIFPLSPRGLNFQGLW